MSTATDPDPIEASIWQPDGIFFRVRTRFKSGVISNPSVLLEPDMKYNDHGKTAPGCGLYVAIGFNSYLVVGRSVITGFANYLANQDVQRISHTIIRKNIVRDPLRGRDCLCVNMRLDDKKKLSGFNITKPEFYNQGKH